MVGFRFWTMGNDLITYCFMAWLTDRFRRALVEQQAISKALREAKEEVETLEGLFPICAWCKRIRDDRGYWGQIEDYLARHKGAHVSHGICPDCRDKAREEFSGRSSVP